MPFKNQTSIQFISAALLRRMAYKFHEPINEYITPFLATLAFPTMFPDACGDPTNPALL